jgi:hypothetical protein
LATLPSRPSVIEQALYVLHALPSNISDKERADILVPDIQGHFRPVSELYFNDIGDRAYFESTETNLAHPQLYDGIARLLRMKRLGLTSLNLNPGIDMGEKLTTTIRNVLKQYTEQQILTEFLANASDAGADEFKILLDERSHPEEKLLTPHMAPLQRLASVVIYNNSVFTPKDFDGICRTGVGGKEGQTNTIGQFGLGALSMFHFTEVCQARMQS